MRLEISEESRRVPEAAHGLVRLEVVCRSPEGVRPLCDFVIERWLPAMFPGAMGRRVAMHAADGPKWVKVTNISTKAGAAKFDAAVARVDSSPRGGIGLSLISWISGRPFGYGPVGDDDIWVSVDRVFDSADLHRIRMFCPTEKAPQLVSVAVDVSGHFEVLSGGAWAPGGFFPSWADHRWTIRVLSPPQVAGPIWLVVAPKAANQLLTASELASNMAVATHYFEGGGAVWQLSDECHGPAGPDLDHWAGLLIDLGLWHGPGD